MLRAAVEEYQRLDEFEIVTGGKVNAGCRTATELNMGGHPIATY